MKSKPPPPCRLQVLLARRAPIGVIFRRGPSKWVQIIKWDTQRDVFEEGKWFHGHIYVGKFSEVLNSTTSAVARFIPRHSRSKAAKHL